METSPKVSIIIPVYNTAKYLKKCLDSLRFQTYHNLEIICVDDGSTDDSLSVLKEYAETDSRFCVYEQQHQGTSIARNRGVTAASGEYISFIDSDDWVLLTLYETFTDYLNNCAGVVDVYMFNAARYVFGENDSVPKVFFEISDWKNHTDKFAIHTFSDCKRPFSRNLSAANKIYRKEFLTSNNIIFPENLKYEDQYFYIQSFLNAKSILINEDCFYRYRNMNDNSSTLEITQKVFDIFKVIDLVESEIDRLGVYEHYKYALFQYKFKVYASHYRCTPQECKQRYFDEMKARLLDAEKRDLDSRIYTQLTNFEIFTKIKFCDFNDFERFMNP